MWKRGIHWFIEVSSIGTACKFCAHIQKPNTYKTLQAIFLKSAEPLRDVARAKIFLASATAAATTHIILSQLASHHWTKLIIGGTIFLITYLTTTPLIRAVNKSDIKNLKEILSDLRPLSHIFNLPLNTMEKLMLISQKA